MTDLILKKNEVPEFLKDKITGKGRGNENVTLDELVLPRLEIVQALSPCRKKETPDYIKGAEEGMLYNNVTRELLGTEVSIVFVDLEVEYILWNMKVKEFRGRTQTMQEAISKREALEDSAVVEIIKNHLHYCIMINPYSKQPQDIVLSMNRSKEKVSKRLNTTIKMSGGDRFSRVYSLRTTLETNKKGDSYYTFKIEHTGFPNEVLYERAEKIYALKKEGSLKVNQEPESDLTDKDEY